ncbi:MAG: bifunctional phosphoribosylaminoimidazolecarboxamide formyltransferase/IMP cyclohydrolase [Halobacteriovoraceae bacterium]|nr:bifunctional phosphoribosylaminoimidazolecarboxamide formyltransferase/IMP cyclohydrolase [Halobacteriovoraceae bacterium]
MTSKKIKNALISVSDKTHLTQLAKEISAKGVGIISTGGTGKLLAEHGIPFTPIEEVTGNPEAFDGRMKTLSFQIESALLYDRDNPEHVHQAEQFNIFPIDLLICNLYPFEKVASESNDIQKLIENIDIGGPTMIRASAKNYKHLTVLTDPSQYQAFLEEFHELDGETSIEFREKLAIQAFNKTYHYDEAITLKLGTLIENNSVSTLRYGENPHQAAYILKEKNYGLQSCTQLHGKELSYNNYLDMNAAYQIISELNYCDQKRTYFTVIKHCGPCGLASSSDSLRSLEMAWIGDPVSAFGSIVATNKTVDSQHAHFLASKFVEIVMAPDFDSEALEILKKKKNIRILKTQFVFFPEHLERREVAGSMLIQQADRQLTPPNEWTYPTKKKLEGMSEEFIQFGNICCKHLKSNAICIVSQSTSGDYWMSGAGAGQPNRLDSFQIAAKKYYENKKNHSLEFTQKSIVISDAFFPFDDIVRLIPEIDIDTVVQPGGSMRDSEVIETCDSLEMSMVFTGQRHFNH